VSTDPYVDRESGVLINKLGITDPYKLDQAERDITRVRMAELDRNPIKGNFDLAHLQAIHKHIAGDVYAWAGQIRTVDMMKGDSMFARVDRIVPEANKAFGALAAENHLKGQFSDQFVRSAAEHFSNINALHPFREVNGRAQVAMFRQLAAESGKHLSFSAISAKQWNEANARAHAGDTRMLESAFKSALIAGRELTQGIQR
jgi:cell filamentation protein